MDNQPASAEVSAAPASVATSEAPSIGGGNFSDFMSGLSGSSSPAPKSSASEILSEAPASDLDVPGVGTEGPKEEVVPASAPIIEPDKPEITAQTPVEPKQPDSIAKTTDTPKKLLADKFATPEELEKAYIDMSKQSVDSVEQGKRMGTAIAEMEARLKTISDQSAAKQAELDRIKLEMELGPDIVDPSAEEMSTWDASKIAKHEISKLRREQTKGKLEADKKATADAKRIKTENIVREIEFKSNKMLSEPDLYPNFKAYESSMSSFLDLAPGLVGHENTPLILYLTAYGHAALQRDRAGIVATKKSADEAKLKVASAVPAAGGSMGGAGGAQPAPKPAASTGNDGDFLAAHIEATTGHRPLLPMS